MEATLLTYGPRIRLIDVEIIENYDPGVLVSFEITCHLKEARLVSIRHLLRAAGAHAREAPDSGARQIRRLFLRAVSRAAARPSGIKRRQPADRVAVHRCQHVAPEPAHLFQAGSSRAATWGRK